MSDLNARLLQATQPYLLDNAFILTNLPDRDRELLLDHCPVEHRRRGDVLYRQGAFPKGAFWIRSGKLKILQELPDGHRQTLYVYSDGDLAGYRQLISEEAYPISGVLLEDSTVVFIPVETFRALLDASPFFARNILTALAREFSVWMNRLTLFAQLSVRRRLVLALLILYRQYHRPDEASVAITFTRTDLAEYIGATLETVVRGLHGLKEAGLVSTRGRRIVLPDPEGLLDLLQREGH